MMDAFDAEYGDLLGALFPNKYGPQDYSSDVVSYTVKPKTRMVELTNSAGEKGEISCDDLRSIVESQRKMGIPVIPIWDQADKACRNAGVTQTPKDKAEAAASDVISYAEGTSPIWLAAGIVGAALLIKRARK